MASFLSINMEISIFIQEISKKTELRHYKARIYYKTIYRTRAIKGRSRLVAAPLRFQAKNYFYAIFM